MVCQTQYIYHFAAFQLHRKRTASSCQQLALRVHHSTCARHVSSAPPAAWQSATRRRSRPAVGQRTGEDFFIEPAKQAAIYIYMYTYVVHHEEPKAGHNTNSVTQIDSSSSVPAELLEAFPLGLWVHVLCLGSTVWQRTVRHLDQQHGFGAGLKSPEPVLLWRPRRARPED